MSPRQIGYCNPMKSLTCELDACSTVFLGNFNPSIFQPAWLARHTLVGEEEAEKAEIEIIRPEISSFKVGLLGIAVSNERFQAETSSPEAAGPLRDLVLGIFRILEHTPTSKFGINRHMHFRMPSEEAWHRVGHQLVPKEAWEGLLDKPGTRSLVVEGKRRESSARYLRITLEPSLQIQPGVYIGTNEHFEISEKEPLTKLLEVFSAEW